MRRKVALLAVALLPLLGCFVSKAEVARVPSPDGALEAVVTEVDGGATTSYAYVVSLGPAGQRGTSRIAYLDGAARSARSWGVNVRWPTNEAVEIEYLTARETELERSTIAIGGRTIRVTLRSGIDDPAAPPGSMSRGRNER